MPNIYYETITMLEQQDITRDYVVGWASGFLGNPKIEEQRITKSWKAGYEDGSNKNTNQSENWKNKD